MVFFRVPSHVRPELQIDTRSVEAVLQSFALELESWPEVQASGKDTTLDVATNLLRILQECGGGALIVLAPEDQLCKLKVQSTDGGYLNRKMEHSNVSDRHFRETFLAFAQHTDDDCWPPSHADKNAVGLPKDGAWLMSPSGHCAKCAAKVMGLPLSPCFWPRKGTRHETAMQVVACLDRAIVMVRSDSGPVHCLVSSKGGLCATRVVDTSPGYVEKDADAIVKKRRLNEVRVADSARYTHLQPHPLCDPSTDICTV